MDKLELLELISSGETSRVQFKKKLDNKDSFAAEMIAFTNSKGGIIIIGVEDKAGYVLGLSYEDLQEVNNNVATIASDSIKPQIFITTEVVDVDGKKILLIFVDEGVAKPYKDKNGAIWVKQGSDKRRLTDNNEQIRLFQQSGIIYVDEMIIPNSSTQDIDSLKVREYLDKIDNSNFDIENEQLYRNLNIIKNGQVTLGGLLFFATNPQRFRPVFCIKAVSFFGNDIGGNAYRGSVDITGTVPKMFDEGMRFFKSYLHHTQQGQNFNSEGILEILEIALQELLQNALTHRDYSKNAPVKILIFDNRVEIVSPGVLPNSLTVENIKMGNAVVRNNLIVSFASKLMKYRGFGTGVSRSLKEQANIELTNDIDGEQFIVKIPRPEKF